MAERFPNSRITAVSNSNSQREHILATAKARGLSNIEVLTLDLGKAQDLGDGRGDYDRLVSVEMLEHIRNYEKFFATIQKWVKPGARMFIHIFSHRDFPYPFETDGDDNWMGRYFFTGGQMPARNLLGHFQGDFRLLNQWEWNGQHYQKTSEAWLRNMDENRAEIRRVLTPTYGEIEVDRWIQRWRIFFISVAELFGYDEGREWGVSHYLFEKSAK
jgi:cyclopropane-fatty-acyl-phospholipid synthase